MLSSPRPGGAAGQWFDDPYRVVPAGSAAPNAVAIADLNGDGLADIVAGGRGGFAALLGNGGGSFHEAPNSNPTFAIFGVAVGDLNQDGRPDLAFACEYPTPCRVVMGNGDGTFGAPQVVSTGGSEAFAVAIGNMDGNAAPDLALADPRDKLVSVLRNDGDGVFTLASSYPTASAPYSVAIGDMNGDGKLDVVNSELDSSRVSIRLGNGDGTLGAPTHVSTVSFTRSVAIGRVNADSYPDLVVAGFGAASATILLGNGSGGFARADVPACPSAAVRLADLDGNGKLDIVIGDYAQDRIVTLVGDGAGGFGAPLALYGPSPGWYGTLAAGDVDGDGIVDAVSTVAGMVAIAHGNGNGTLGTARTHATAAGPFDAAVADFDSDGVPDVAVSCSAANCVSLLKGNGDGTFSARTDLATGDNPFWVSVADLDADGHKDLVTLDVNNALVSVLLGNESGAFAPHADYGTGADGYGMTVGDLNGDGRSDVIVTRLMPSNAVSVLVAAADGSLAAPVAYADPYSPVDAVLCDLNEDGHLDLACVNSDHTWGLSIWLGTGTGALSARSDFGVDDSGDDISATDADGDGHVDLVITAFGLRRVQIRFGKGNGTFSSVQFWTTPLQIRRPYVGDINGDGPLDLVMGGDGAVSLTPAMLHVPSTAVTYYGTGGYSNQVTVADLNGDGGADILVPITNRNELGILMQRAGSVGVGPQPRVGQPRLLAPWPNPVTSHVTFRFQIASASRVSLEVYDLTGRRVHHDDAGPMAAGAHELTWSGRSRSGERVPGGIYFVRLTAGVEHDRQTFVVLH
jgi:hypothetical protein